MSASLSSPGAARRGLSVAAVGGVVAASLAVLAAQAPAQAANPVDFQIIATNDFHGRLAQEAPANGNDGVGGAAVLSQYVKDQRALQPSTHFVAAGDLIGASTFDSFIQKDKPTIDALNEAGLDVSAAGNHEFDAGYDDLKNRVMAPYDATTNPLGGAEWEYIAANVKLKTGGDALAPSWTSTFNTGTANEVTVGYVGAVTEHLDELVSPAGIADLEVTDVVQAVNTEADELKAAGADVVVMLVHEGAPSTDCATMDDDPASDFGSIVTGVNANVDAIVSGHTHLAYDCSFPVAAWSGRAVTERPVVSAGQYGTYVNNLNFTVDTEATGASKVTSIDTAITAMFPKAPVPVTPINTGDPLVKTIVDAAVTKGNELGAEVLGKIGGEFNRAQRPRAADPSVMEENRGGESTLGNVVAEAQRQATASAEFGSAQIAFMNPGGLRANMTGLPGAFPRDLTYKQAATVQPFANTLNNMKLTGAQIADVLEQQWQPSGASRPFLRLGVSEGFEYTYDPATKQITGMWLNGTPVKDDQTYSVTANSFLAAGGDNFTAFRAGTGNRDTGQVDLAGMVDFMKAYATTPLAVDASQRAVGVSFPAGAPASYKTGDTVAFELSSLAMTGTGDAQDSSVEVFLGSTSLGTVPVDNTVAAGATDDESGKASVSLTVPQYYGAPTALTVVGDTTGTEVSIPVAFAAQKATAKVQAAVTPKKIVRKKTKAKVTVTVTAPTKVTGKVTLKVKGIKKVFTGTVNAKGKVVFTLPKFKKAGKYKATVRYLGSDTVKAATKTVTIRVRR
ncbi:MAG: bifunctional metallophosphatase/5'-nucleotidase [Nocardioides sp.]|uniref:bifunctional metallophosphatase/5'-nucleotidase n=1 Tax=Nocardioides sp. TaxID=35761 RepID=UPI003F0E31C8